ncbi:orotidine 5'-phosphate decarboxylase / HUMPS family protein [Limosilactobacillus mucosae]|uniref:orotidine 5'-phosphate decarboxylase / HUMPS family protein n=1 Tax=Limosilactobacillus mucosae TaxID=97478 RepID=UPI00233EF510|nr:orotidine 5'-phosphate decarboxylase / HUMPS family protein [Limosilactobacillus mucosae]MDC2841081.1 orotidine 5'-phosphate decarboxylase [Limosilactobacillus mucosae]
MKLQAAIDRVTLEQAKNLARQLDPIVDIIEMGTSLIKDYGFYALNKEELGLQHAELLLDAKTIDEGQYEFEKGFATGADILTVMGAASQGTLETTYKVTQQYDRQMFIDLMEVNDQKLAAIDHFENAIYGLHHAKDDTGTFDATDSVASFHQKYPHIKRINVAGGIDISQARKLKAQGIAETVIVGSKIIEAADPVAAAKEFMKEVK